MVPLLTIGLGLATIAWSLFGLRVTSPPPEAPIALPEIVEAPLPLETLAATEESGDQKPMLLYPKPPAEGDYVGTISLPSLDLNWPIFEGTTQEQLARGVGHFSDSVLPGIADNSVLSGHRTTVFGRLGELNEGDLIAVKTSAGIFTYEIREFRVVPKSSREVIVPTPSAVLTLTTCFPFYSPIPTTEAFIVTADLIHSELVSSGDNS